MMNAPPAWIPAVCIAVAAVEYGLTRSLWTTPCVVVFLTLLQWLDAEQVSEARHKREFAQTLSYREGIDSLHAVHSTDAETAEWTTLFLAQMWHHLLVPVLRKMVMCLAMEQVERVLGRKAQVDIAQLDFGTTAPVIERVHAVKDGNKRLKYIDADFNIATEGMDIRILIHVPRLKTIVVKLEELTATGTFRLTPMLEQRLVFFAFARTPKFDYRQQIFGPVGAKIIQKLLDSNRLKELIADVTYEKFVEPRRIGEGMEFEPTFRRPVSSRLHLRLLGFKNFSCSSSGDSDAADGRMVQVSVSIEGAIGLRRLTSKPFAPSTAPFEAIAFELPFELPPLLTMVALTVTVHAVNNARKVLACAEIKVNNLKNGGTMFYGIGADGDALAHRLDPEDVVWEVDWPLELPVAVDGKSSFALQDRYEVRHARDVLGCGMTSMVVKHGFAVPSKAAAMAHATLQLSMDPWMYKQPIKGCSFRTAGPRTIVLQVLEGENMQSKNGKALAESSVRLSYSEYAPITTHAVMASDNPVWHTRVHRIAEDQRVSCRRRILVEVLDRGGSVVGHAHIRLSQIHEQLPEDKWVDIVNLSTALTVGARVRVYVAIVPGKPDSDEVVAAVKEIEALDNTFEGSSPDALEIQVLQIEHNPQQSPMRGTPVVHIGYGSKKYGTVEMKKQDSSDAGGVMRAVVRTQADTAVEIGLSLRSPLGVKSVAGSTLPHAVLLKTAFAFCDWLPLSGLRVLVKVAPKSLARRTACVTVNDGRFIDDELPVAVLAAEPTADDEAVEDDGDLFGSPVADRAASDANEHSTAARSPSRTGGTRWWERLLVKQTSGSPRAAAQSSSDAAAQDGIDGDVVSDSDVVFATVDTRTNDQSIALGSMHDAKRLCSVETDPMTMTAPLRSGSSLPADEGALVEIKVVRGRDLVPCDSNNKSDPYIILRYGKGAARRSQVRYATLEPVWNFSCTLPLQTAADLLIQVWDEDRWSHDRMGRCTVTAAELNACNWCFKRWLRLTGVPSGEIYVEMQLTIESR